MKSHRTAQNTAGNSLEKWKRPFGYFPKTGNLTGNFGEVDRRLADLMESYWTNFAKTGNPNGGKLPNWPEFDGTQSFHEQTPSHSLIA
jgi:hypothetical protein